MNFSRLFPCLLKSEWRKLNVRVCILIFLIIPFESKRIALEQFLSFSRPYHNSLWLIMGQIIYPLSPSYAESKHLFPFVLVFLFLQRKQSWYKKEWLTRPKALCKNENEDGKNRYFLFCKPISNIGNRTCKLSWTVS